MTTSEVIGQLALAGVRLSVNGDRLIVESQTALTDDLRGLIRENKTALLQALSPVARCVELRRQRALAKLAAEPDRQRVAIFDTDSDRNFAICTIAIRGVGTCEMRIPKDHYDPWAVLEALQRTQ
jgi:hypothetical protein